MLLQPALLVIDFLVEEERSHGVKYIAQFDHPLELALFHDRHETDAVIEHNVQRLENAVVRGYMTWELYHQIGFRLCKLDRVKRSDYIRIDRQKLAYLNPMEKLNCMYCGYANGLLRYAAEIAGRTEQYWCGIRHEEKGDFHMPEHHKNFTEFGNKEEFEARYKA